ncbi:hypothetical protein BpHYR1_054687, partial [Brachionus plicatilis]
TLLIPLDKERKPKRLKSKYAEFRPLYNKLTKSLETRIGHISLIKLAKTQNLYKNSIFDSEIDTGNCFGEILKDTFSLNNDFINVSSDREDHKFVNDYFN